MFYGTVFAACALSSVSALFFAQEESAYVVVKVAVGVGGLVSLPTLKTFPKWSRPRVELRSVAVTNVFVA